MSSLRRFLLVTVLSTLVLVNFLSALHGYQKSMAAASAIFDHKLSGFARQLLALPDIPLPDAAPDEDGLLFQLVDADYRVYWRSVSAPEQALQVEPGFSDVNFGHRRWRVYVEDDESPPRRVIVAERMDQRFDLAERIVLESVLPVLLILPLAGILIWIIVSYGLRSVSRLADILRHKSSDDLNAVTLHSAPQELAPVVASVNSLMARLDAAFARERRFSADAAHELRGPIAAIKMHLHNAMSQPDGDEESMKLLRADVHRLSHLVEQMLDLHRTNPEYYPAKFELLSLDQLGRDMIRREYANFEAKQQSIEFSGAAADIQGDRFALEILLQNLLRNASKYTPSGGEIQVLVANEADRVRLTVMDDGPGIPEGQQERIFERFYRVGGDRHSSGEQGCGLGLSIVAHIAALHRAEVSLDSGIGGAGLAVSIHFPKNLRA